MKNPTLAFVAAALLGLSAPSLAGPFADDLSKCLVSATTPTEKTDLVQWIFAVIALHPDVAELSSVSAKKRAELNRELGALFVDLITKRCGEQTKAAIKNEGMGVISTSFGVLGQSATQELFANPAVAKGLEEFGEALEGLDLEALK